MLAVQPETGVMRYCDKNVQECAIQGNLLIYDLSDVGNVESEATAAAPEPFKSDASKPCGSLRAR